MVQRLSYRRHNHYNTPSNKVKVVKVPGNRNVYHYIQKSAGRPKCGDCKKPLNGIPALRPHEYANTPRKDVHVSRAYGGSRCHRCLRTRIVRAFLLEEQKCVKVVLLEKEKQRAETNKKGTKGKKSAKAKKAPA